MMKNLADTCPTHMIPPSILQESKVNNKRSQRANTEVVFDSRKTIKDQINKHKQIIGIKPVTRNYLNFHAKDLGISDHPETMADSKIFFDPTYHHMRTSFAREFLREVFLYDPKRPVKMCLNPTAQTCG